MAGWSNWAREQHCSPALVARPATVAELVAMVREAGAAGRTVRVAGAGHSFSDIVLTDGVLILPHALDRVVDVDRERGLVTVEAGITLHALSAELAELGLAFENLGDIDVQTLAGAIATGTHGTGGRLRNISAQVAALDLVLADGTLLHCSEDEEPDVWRAARVSVGALGAIARVTLRCVPAFVLHAIDRPAPLEATLDDLDALVDGNDHYELFGFPHADTALTRTNNRTDVAARPRNPVAAWLDDVALKNGVLDLVCRVGRRLPARIPQLNRLVVRLAGTQELIDRSDRVFATPRLLRFTEMEYAIPRAHAAEAVRAVRALIDRERFAVNFPIELRFVAGDDAFLSPAHDRATAYVAVHTYQGMAYEPYFRAVEAIMDGFGGRPHWGKRHFQTAATLRERYPRWDAFQAVRARLDPDGRFTNAAVERVLGPVVPPA